jgi:hypothetical protein
MILWLRMSKLGHIIEWFFKMNQGIAVLNKVSYVTRKRYLHQIGINDRRKSCHCNHGWPCKLHQEVSSRAHRDWPQTIEELSNPLDESTNMDGATDEEIYKAVTVIVSRDTAEMSWNDIGDKDDDTAWVELELPPSLHELEVFQAQISVEKYIAIIDKSYASWRLGAFSQACWLFCTQTWILEVIIKSGHPEWSTSSYGMISAEV